MSRSGGDVVTSVEILPACLALAVGVVFILIGLSIVRKPTAHRVAKAMVESNQRVLKDFQGREEGFDRAVWEQRWFFSIFFLVPGVVVALLAGIAVVTWIYMHLTGQPV